MTPATDLLERCRKDDRKAHYELYKLCFPFLVSVCRRYYINKEDMQSSLNQIYLKMIMNMASYLKKKESVPFELWSRRIAINHIIDEFRKNKKHKENIDYRELNDAIDIHPVIDPVLEKEKLEEVLTAINQLSHMNRTVFNLFVIDGYGHEEIAEMLKISSGTSKSHLHSARNKLKELLNNDWEKKDLIHNAI